jgi:hypothetical protein
MMFNATIELKATDLEQLVREAVLKMTPGFEVTSIVFEVGTESYYRNENVAAFKGVKVNLKPKGSDPGMFVLQR